MRNNSLNFHGGNGEGRFSNFNPSLSNLKDSTLEQQILRSIEGI